jgi:V-type H+-transporting ATPase subunit C
LTLSDALPKHDAYFTSVVAKLLDTIKSLAAGSAQSQSASSSTNDNNADKDKLESYARINDLPPTQYLIPHSGARQGWTWDAARWGQDGKVTDVVEALVKEMNSIDSIQKQKVQGYNLAKGSLAGMQRKKM